VNPKSPRFHQHKILVPISITFHSPLSLGFGPIRGGTLSTTRHSSPAFLRSTGRLSLSVQTKSASRRECDLLQLTRILPEWRPTHSQTARPALGKPQRRSSSERSCVLRRPNQNSTVPLDGPDCSFWPSLSRLFGFCIPQVDDPCRSVSEVFWSRFTDKFCQFMPHHEDKRLTHSTLVDWRTDPVAISEGLA